MIGNVFAILLCCLPALTPGQILWPVEGANIPSKNDSLEAWAQATASGKLISALFGGVRNNGRRFHEGLDIAPIAKRTRSGEATDIIIAALSGKVAYINPSSGASSYGRYVVLTHNVDGLTLYTLYAHLARIEPGLTVGQSLRAGNPIGIMGRSAGGYTIPRSRAHLHFEIGFLKAKDFQSWYAAMPFGNHNQHGSFNGINLIGFDPLKLFVAVRDGKFRSFDDHVRNLQTAFTLRVSTNKVPEFVKMNPDLVTRSIPIDKIVGWIVDFTWYGLPKQWMPVTADEVPMARYGDIALLYLNHDAFAPHCDRTFVMRGGKADDFTVNFRDGLRLIFGFR